MLKKMFFLIFHIFLFCFLGLADAGQESIELFNLYTISREEFFPKAMSHSGLAISLSDRDLSEVSSSVIKAETWLRTNVLSHYPSKNITTILVGDTLLCPKTHQDQEQTNLSLTLQSLKNLFHSLTRWGLERDIKLSVSLSHSCMKNHPQESTFFNPILEFLTSKNSTYSIKLSPLPYETSTTMKRVGLYGLKNINLIITKPKLTTKRKLTSLSDPFPTRPNPMPKTSEPPIHSSVGFSVPSTLSKPPQAQIASPPEENDPTLSPQLASQPPLFEPTSPPLPYPYPYGPTLPPCYSPSPLSSPVGAPHHHHHPVGEPMPAVTPHGLWCVAKPSVPVDTLQAAMDYACGEGGADCGEIGPSGSCYNPDTVVAHASYALNSYWQKHKRNGGTCSFGGTAMLINNDPSFLHCRFILT